MNLAAKKFTFATFFLIPFASEKTTVSASASALSMYVNPRVCGTLCTLRFTLTALSAAPLKSLNFSCTEASVLYSMRATWVPVSETSNWSTKRSRNNLNCLKFLLLMLPEIEKTLKILTYFTKFKWIYGLMDGGTGGRKEGRREGWLGGGMDGWIDNEFC